MLPKSEMHALNGVYCRAL